MLFRRIAGIYVFLLVFSTAPAAQQKDVASETARLIELLQLQPTSTVADIGAGEGQITAQIAKQLGRGARVYSTDVNETTVAGLKKLVDDNELTNVTVLEGEPEATNLPVECCDAVFVRNVYHHFANPMPMNASIMRTLKPGGRFAVMDFPPRNRVTDPVPPARRSAEGTHGVTSDAVVAELKDAGFQILQVLPEWPGGLFMVLARKPTQSLIPHP